MRKKVPNKDINDSIKSSTKPTAYSNNPYPLNELSDRNFEILVYHLFKERILVKDIELSDNFDSVALMQGVGERGRDISLIKSGKNVGLVQCKKIKTNLSRTEVAQEIIKFALYSIVDDTLLEDRSNFIYYFTVSTGFSGPAIEFLTDFNKQIVGDPKLQEWTENVIKEYIAFSHLKYPGIKADLLDVLSKIRIKKIIPQDLELWLSQFDKVAKVFFKIFTVTDNTLLENAIDQYLKPILIKLTNGNEDINRKDYEFRFKEYLSKSYLLYSSAKTLVFGNQQKKLDDIYYPLTVTKKETVSKGKDRKVRFKIDKYSDDFIPTYKKVLIVDDGGMGKSTLLKWLYLSIIKQKKGIPIFIELRHINPGHNLIDEINARLEPFTSKTEKQLTQEILSSGNFIFLLDGYDEVKFEHREFVTLELERFTSIDANNFYVITSRPEQALITFGDFQEFNIDKLTREEAFELIKKIDDYQPRSLMLIKEIENRNLRAVEEFLENPLLVSLLYKKFEYRETIPFNKQEFYYEVFEAFYQAHDLSKGGSYVRPKECGLSLPDFFKILRGLGYKSIKAGIEFSEGQIIDTINAVAKDFSIDKLKADLFLSDLVKAVPLFQKDGLQYKWSHKSIQQYFAAEYICRDAKSRQAFILLSMYDSERVDSYKNILELCFEIDFKAFRDAILFKYCQDFVGFVESSYIELKGKEMISKKEILRRQELTFNRSLGLVTGLKEFENHIARIITQLPTQSLRFEILDIANSVLLFNSTLPRKEMIDDFLLKAKHPLVSLNKLILTAEEKDMLVQALSKTPGHYTFINDSLNNPINTLELFGIINSLSSQVPRVKYSVAKNLIKEVENEKRLKAQLESEEVF